MKTLTSKSFAIVLFLSPFIAFADSGCATLNHVGNSVDLSLQASGEGLSAVGDSAKGSLQVAAGAVAVPVWIAGSVAEGSAELSGALADGSAKAGENLWDFATSDTSKRPALDNTAGLPKAKVPAKPAEVSPGEAMKNDVK